MGGKITAVCISKNKGTQKKNVHKGYLKENFGLDGDAHAGNWHRQVSLLSIESIQNSGLKNISYGDFGENLTTKELDLKNLEIGAKLQIGNNAILEVSQIGKECIKPCAIYYKTGKCIMPGEGIFARVIKAGEVRVGDEIICLKTEKMLVKNSPGL